MKSLNFILCLSLLALSSCAQLRPYKKIKSLHLTDDFYEKKNMGLITRKDCKGSIGKYTTGEPAYEEAFDKVVRAHGGLSYLVDLTYRTSENGVTDLKGNKIIGKSCIIVKARGYK
jgi:hypothetical protein